MTMKDHHPAEAPVADEYVDICRNRWGMFIETSHPQADMPVGRYYLNTEVAALRDSLRDCFRVAGGDTSSGTESQQAAHAVAVVEDLRECYEERGGELAKAESEVTALRAELRDAEAEYGMMEREVISLRAQVARVRALADRLSGNKTTGSDYSSGYCDAQDDCATQLRATLEGK
jgi:hypothetical protein